ncbi:YfiH family protein [Meiothermus luteus]|uniref:YfiH family protein n=1 Tax=Meiothermus luteus TaxID=2026184 RepID=A0A399EQB1_9DEIN|nr:YfiH family protein [Meiothermus luteus]
MGGILPQALALARARYGVDPAHLRVAVGPGIGGCCYWVGPEVVERFEAAALPFYRPDPERPGRYRLDLEAAIRFQALKGGVRSEHYWALGSCTYTDNRFFSHRRDGGRTGRMWALIMLPG